MSDEYINKEDAIQSIIAHDLVGGNARGWAEYLLEYTSTADVAPVVRCGDCKYLMASGICNMFADDNIKPSASDFCSCGERKDNG